MRRGGGGGASQFPARPHRDLPHDLLVPATAIAQRPALTSACWSGRAYFQIAIDSIAVACILPHKAVPEAGDASLIVIAECLTADVNHHSQRSLMHCKLYGVNTERMARRASGLYPASLRHTEVEDFLFFFE
ncbi:unnamed protein product, partial [Iphiclides podalirius]